MKIELLFLTCNRLHYTKLSLPALLSDPTEEFSLTIWDNGSTDGTKEFLSSVKDSRIVRKVFSEQNIGAIPAINEVFFNSSADLIGLIADDLLVTAGWTRILAQAHAEVPEFGMIACWHLGSQFFDEARARRKIQKFGRHHVLRHPWTNGGAGLIKVKTLREAGPIGSDWCGYWMQIALRGYINGYYLPLINVEHMDYAWSKYFSGRFKEGINVADRRHGIRTMEDAKAWHQVVLKTIFDEPWDVKYYVGWRGKLRRIKKRVKILFSSKPFSKIR